MNGYGKRVLIIDDAQDLHYLTAVVLANVGYNVYSAFDGLEGLHEMKKRRYDVVLVDYHMPRLNGLQFVEISRTTWPETPNHSVVRRRVRLRSPRSRPRPVWMLIQTV